MDVHVVIEPDGDRWLAEVPELHVLAGGGSRGEARARALEAAKLAIDSYTDEELRAASGVLVEAARV